MKFEKPVLHGREKTIREKKITYEPASDDYM